MENRDLGPMALVYVGGHHEVYCQRLSGGAMHLRLKGAGLGFAPISKDKGSLDVELFTCDCEKYKAKEVL